MNWFCIIFILIFKRSFYRCLLSFVCTIPSWRSRSWLGSLFLNFFYILLNPCPVSSWWFWSWLDLLFLSSFNSLLNLISPVPSWRSWSGFDFLLIFFSYFLDLRSVSSCRPWRGLDFLLFSFFNSLLNLVGTIPSWSP